MKRLHTALSIFAAAAVLAPASGALARRPVFQHHHADHEGEEQDHSSNRSPKPTKASAPGLTLHSRSLLAKDGKTEVEISTAPFDIGATAPGNITEVDIRAVDPKSRNKDKDEQGEKNDRDGKDDRGDRDGRGDRDDRGDRGDRDGRERRFHKEYDHLRQGGYVHWFYPGLPHGQALRIKAEARAAAHGREVEARWLDYVRYRPDLAVQMVDAPGLAPVNTMVQVNATVAERMGELGAHADCVLLVDDVQVDSAQSMWVDAKSTVGCRFTTSFKSPGLHTIKVRAQNVRPGDYDDSNNEFTRQIQVQSSATLYYDMLVQDQVQTSTTTTDSYYTSTSSPPEEHRVQTTNNYMQTRQFFGTIPAAVGDVKRLSFSDSSGGKTLGSVTLDIPPFASIVPVDPSFCDPGSTSELMLNDFDLTTGRAVTVIRCFNANTSQGNTIISVAWSAFDNTFFSKNTCNTLALGCVSGDYTTGGAEGTRVQLADDYSASFTLEDGSVYTANPKMPLPVIQGSTTPVTTSSCTDTDFHTGTMGKVCVQIVSLNYFRQGDLSTLPPMN